MLAGGLMSRDSLPQTCADRWPSPCSSSSSSSDRVQAPFFPPQATAQAPPAPVEQTMYASAKFWSQRAPQITTARTGTTTATSVLLPTNSLNSGTPALSPLMFPIGCSTTSLRAALAPVVSPGTPPSSRAATSSSSERVRELNWIIGTATPPPFPTVLVTSSTRFRSPERTLGGTNPTSKPPMARSPRSARPRRAGVMTPPTASPKTWFAATDSTIMSTRVRTCSRVESFP